MAASPLARYLASVYRDERVLAMPAASLESAFTSFSLVYHTGLQHMPNVTCRSWFMAWRPAMGMQVPLIHEEALYPPYLVWFAAGLGPRDNPRFAPDRSWAEVMRIDPGAAKRGGDCYFELSRGSGVAVYVNRSLRVQSRRELAGMLSVNLTRIFKTPARGNTHIWVHARRRGANQTVWPPPLYEGLAMDDEVGLRRRYFENDPKRLDLKINLCERIKKLGYDSLQVRSDSCAVQSEQGACQVELLLCNDVCTTFQSRKREDLGLCMHGLPLRTGWDLTRECRCDPSKALLNCAKTTAGLSEVDAPPFVDLPPKLSPIRRMPWCEGGLTLVQHSVRKQQAFRVAVGRMSQRPTDGACFQQPRTPALTGSLREGRSGVAIYTAIFGGYEKTFKEPSECSVPMFGYSDNRTSIKLPKSIKGVHGRKSCWTRVFACHHLSLDVTTGRRNSIDSNRSPFNVAKFYKMNPHRLPELRPFQYVIWLDGTVQLSQPLSFPLFRPVLEHTTTTTLFEHCAPLHLAGKASKCRHGLLKNEVNASMALLSDGEVYEGQDFVRQKKYYLNESGFRERWFQGEREAMDRPNYGVWVTCLVILNLRNRDTLRFLDQWWIENTNTTTQDQITFVFAAWRTGLLPHSLPGHGVKGSWAESTIHVKLGHGI